MVAFLKLKIYDDSRSSSGQSLSFRANLSSYRVALVSNTTLLFALILKSTLLLIVFHLLSKDFLMFVVVADANYMLVYLVC